MDALLERDTAMARSNRIAMLGVVYFVGLMVAWIVYASYRGI